MSVALLTDKRYLEHDQPAHPENASRLLAIWEELERTGLRGRMQEITPHPATDEQILAAHSEWLLANIEHAPPRGTRWLTADTYMTAGSFEAALLAAGAAAQAAEAVLAGQVRSAFAIGRPPGHHATATTPMGFCLLNNVAIAARAALRQVERVAIIDWDVHHGNGTQDIFWEDRQVLFCSTHAYGDGFYPGTGGAEEIGDEAGHGLTLNVPLPFGAGDEAIQSVFRELIVPAVRTFEPQLILISAGYDAHWADPLGPLQLTVGGFRELASIVYNLANECCDGKLVCVLEGGYNTAALAASVAATVRVLLDDPEQQDDPFGEPRHRQPDVSGLIKEIKDAHPLFTSPGAARPPLHYPRGEGYS